MSNETATQSNVADGLLVGKVIAIIGASAGIGAAPGRLSGREGAAPTLGARWDGRLADLVEKLRSDGAEVEHCRCDIDSAADTTALVDKTLARYERLDGAFNNAGTSGGGGGRLADLSEERFDELSRVNSRASGSRCARRSQRCCAIRMRGRSSTPAASVACGAPRTSAHTRRPSGP
jgi:NAD(P)-dependent dehydrogenase (short-subunit alcohol dehydrogenase family)